MALVKVIDGKYYSEESISNLIEYVTDENKTQNYIGAIGMNGSVPEKMIQQMKAVKRGFGKEKGYRQARHLIVSFENEMVITPAIAYFIAYDIAGYYSDKYQICFGVHMNTDNIHIHFIQNTVSYINGKLFSGGPVELAQFKRHVDSVIYKYRIADIDPMQVLDDDF